MKIKNVILAVLLMAGIVLSTLFARQTIESKQQEKKATQDSIALLNRILVQENQKYINVLTALDSISRKGGVLGFTNFENKPFELRLIAK